jgi:hypothetical protein
MEQGYGKGKEETSLIHSKLQGPSRNIIQKYQYNAIQKVKKNFFPE